MRERGRRFRERGRRWRVVARRMAPLAPYLFGGALMAHVGAFGTDGDAAGLRYTYFIGLNAAAALAAAGLRRLLRPIRASLARAVLEAGGLAAAVTPLVWVAAAVLLDGDPHPARMVALFGQVAPVMALYVPLARLARASMPTPPVASPPPTFRELLPPALRDAAIVAIEAQDHYLRVHTDRGAALVLCRLSEAVAQLAGVEGARTHRSWWVARDAVLGTRRGRGRGVLQLRDGLSAPVSRTYAPALRQAGWFSDRAAPAAVAAARSI